MTEPGGTCSASGNCDTTAITSQSTFLAISSESEAVTSAECRQDFATVDCGSLDQGASTGWEAHGSYYKVGCIRVTYSAAAITTWEFTREPWSNMEQYGACGVHVLHNNVVVASVPEGVGDDSGHKMTVDVTVEPGDNVELCEGLDSNTVAADNILCGFHIYSIKTCLCQASGN